MEHVWTGIKIIIGMCIGWWAGLPAALQALALLQLLDIISGIIAAGQEGRITSDIAWRGFRRKASAWLIVGMVGIVQAYLGVGLQVTLVGFAPAEIVAGYFATSEAISIMENAQKLGLPIPAFISNALAASHKQFDQPQGK